MGKNFGTIQGNSETTEAKSQTRSRVQETDWGQEMVGGDKVFLENVLMQLVQTQQSELETSISHSSGR